MKKLLLLVPLVLGTVFSLAACSQAGSETPGNASTSDVPANEVTGIWRMTSLEVGAEGALEEIPYTGQIAFTENTVSVQAMNPDPEAEDTVFTLGGYEAFYGDAVIDSDAGTFSVMVESAAARGLIGQTLERRFEVTGDTLVLTPVNPADGFRVTYERHSE